MQVTSGSWNFSTVSFKECGNYHIHCLWNLAWDELYLTEDDTSDTESFADSFRDGGVSHVSFIHHSLHRISFLR